MAGTDTMMREEEEGEGEEEKEGEGEREKEGEGEEEGKMDLSKIKTYDAIKSLK